jgi:NAD(P)-dependent dehydrogenase (short-subunit alcohol dehydrogenase family)
MIKNRHGSIINIVSCARGAAGRTVYCTSKAALASFTYSLAAELGPAGVRVNAVTPGLIETAMAMQDQPSPVAALRLDAIPIGRIGQPREVADAVVFLASDRASYINGASILVDGGVANSLSLPESAASGGVSPC